MPAPKGNKYAKNTKRGPGKINKEFYSIYKDILNGETDRIAPAFEAVYKKDKFKYLLLIEKFMAYIAPKLSSTSLSNPDGSNLLTNSLNIILTDAGPPIATDEQPTEG